MASESKKSEKRIKAKRAITQHLDGLTERLWRSERYLQAQFLSAYQDIPNKEWVETLRKLRAQIADECVEVKREVA